MKLIIAKQKNLFLLVAIFLLAVILRVWYVSGNNVMFWFDQARDATIIESIVKDGDIKIQGPSAGGTDDTVFHGVLYYYFMLPIYILSNWSPQWASYILSFLASFVVFIVYAMTMDILKSEKKKELIGLLAAFLVAVSATHVQEGTWLSNPVLMTWSVPLFFWMLWKVFFAKEDRHFLYLLFFFLGISNQAAIFTVYLFGPLLVGYLYRANKEKKWILFSMRQLVFAGLTYLATISTMILTELLMLQRGVLTANILNKTSEHFVEGVELFVMIYETYFRFFLRLLSPTDLLLFFLPAIFLLWLGYKSLPNKLKIFFLSAIFSPLWLLTWHYRTSLHLFIGINVIVYLLWSYAVIKQSFTYLGKVLMIAVVVIYALLNLFALKSSSETRTHMYAIQTGTLVSEQLGAIDKSYELAGGEPFSISTLTAPYGVNVTWAYLYSHYGQQKYGYTPLFFGPPQAGWFGDDLLAEIDRALPVHFTIIEPDVYVWKGTADQFLIDQTGLVAPVAESFEFGSLVLEYRVNERDESDAKDE